MMTVTPDFTTQPLNVVTLTADTHFNLPSNAPAGTHILIIKQAGGPWSVTWDGGYEWVGKNEPVLSGGKDIITFVVDEAGVVIGVAALDVGPVALPARRALISWLEMAVASGGGGGGVSIANVQLPLETWEPAYSVPTGGTTRYVSSDGFRDDDVTPADYTTLQAAINAANRGDVIAIKTSDVQQIATTDLVLKAKGAGTDWIYIMPESMAGIPAAGTRVISGAYGDTANITTIPEIRLMKLGASTHTVVKAEDGASYYRLVGLRIRVDPNDATITTGSYVCNLYSTSTLGSQPNHIVVDRCVVYGGLNQAAHAIHVGGPYYAIVDSEAEATHSGADAQAVWGYNAPGPCMVRNNTLRATGENLMTGGADPSSPDHVPSDWTIIQNWCHKPHQWYVDEYVNLTQNYAIKNLFEIKIGKRFLIEDNVFENMWEDAQAYAIVLKCVNQSGGTLAPGITEDITFRWNRIHNVSGGFNIASAPEGPVYAPLTRLAVYHNLLSDGGNFSDYASSSVRRCVQLLGSAYGDGVDMYLAHNSFGFEGTHAWVADTGSPEVFMVNNLFGLSTYDFFVTGGNPALVADYACKQNAIPGADDPVDAIVNDGNTFTQPSNTAGVFTDAPNGNYTPVAAFLGIADTSIVDVGFANLGCDLTTLASRLTGVRNGGDL